VLYSLCVHFLEDCCIALDEGWLGEEGFAFADGEGDDCARLRKTVVDAIGDAGPRFVETIIEDYDSTFGKSAFGGGEIVRGDFRCVAAVDAEEAERAAAERKQMFGGKQGGVAFMNDQAVQVRVAAEIALEAIEIAGAGAVDVQVLMREEIDGDCGFGLCTEEIEQNKQLAVVDADFCCAAG
jgi:hypothetical protein